jgi:hypothetical protein
MLTTAFELRRQAPTETSIEDKPMNRPPLPPFTAEIAEQKARQAEGGCHLIEQRLENVVIAPVDQKHFGIALPQRPRRGHAAKTATDYHDSRLPSHPLDQAPQLFGYFSKGGVLVSPTSSRHSSIVAWQGLGLVLWPIKHADPIARPQNDWDRQRFAGTALLDRTQQFIPAIT